MCSNTIESRDDKRHSVASNFLSHFIGRVTLSDARMAFDIYVDASLPGIGACWDKTAYGVPYISQPLLTLASHS